MRWKSMMAAIALGVVVFATTAHATPTSPTDTNASELQAPSKTTVATLVVLHGTNSGTGIDPNIGNKIGKIDQLKEPPFSSYNSYKLVDDQRLSLDANGSWAVAELPNSGKLQLRLIEKQAQRFLVEASVSKPSGKKFLPSLQIKAPKGKVFFIAGQKYNKGILVLGVRIQ